MLIEFTPDYNGHARVRLEDGDRTFTIDSVRYNTDVVGELLRAALLLVTGAYYCCFNFPKSTPAYRLVATSSADGGSLQSPCSVKLLAFDDADEDLPDRDGRVMFSTECLLGAFGSAVEAVARSGWKSGELRPYHFGNGLFPSRANEALKAAMAVNVPSLPSPFALGGGEL